MTVTIGPKGYLNLHSVAVGPRRKVKIVSFTPPADSGGTLIVIDVHMLGLREQIAFYDWLGHGAGDVRIISMTQFSLQVLTDRGLFLQGLFHRLSAVQFDFTSRRHQRDQPLRRSEHRGAYVLER